MCAGLAFTKSIPAFADALQTGGGWRTFEVTTRVEVLKPSGVTHIWLPAALIRDTPFQRTLSNKFSAESGTAKLTKDKPSALGIVSATYPANAKPVLTLTSRVSMKNYAVDLSAPSQHRAAVSKAELDYFLQPSSYVPTDGIVKETALKATAGATTDVEKARAIYEWVVDNTFRDPKVRGCGRGDIRVHAGVGRYGRQVRRPECALRWPGALRGTAGAAYLWIADREIGTGLQEPGTSDRQSHQGTALPRGGLPARPRLGSGGSGRRTQGGSGGAAWESSS